MTFGITSTQVVSYTESGMALSVEKTTASMIMRAVLYKKMDIQKIALVRLPKPRGGYFVERSACSR